MLERIREGSQGPVAKSILGLVIVTFALAGVGSYINSGGETQVAEVNGTEIKQSELERAYNNEKSRMESQFGDMFSRLTADPTYLANFKNGILERLISDQLILDLASNLSIRVSEEQIKKAIFEMPEFQVEGKFNNDRFNQVLIRAGYTPTQFKSIMRKDMTRRQLVSALTDSEFVLDNEAKNFQQLQMQKRAIEYVEIDVNQFADSVTVTDEQIESHYQLNIAQYETEQQLEVEYLELVMSDLAKTVDISDSEIENFYNENKASYLKPERRRASHILIETGEDEAKAKETIEGLLAQVKQGADFAELAKTHSSDTFSGQNGGDLDFFGKGMMDPAFETAAYALANIGDVSDVVQSGFGFHIIKLTDIEAEQIKPLEDVKDEITSKLQYEAALDVFAEKRQLVEELAFEMPDSLTQAAEEAELEIKSTALFDVASAPYPFSEQKLLDEVLSADVLDEGFNSKLVEVSGEHLVVARVKQHNPARTKPLEEVRADIAKVVSQDLAKDVAKTWIQTLSQKWAASEDIQSLLDEHKLTIETEAELARFGSEVPGAIARKAFEMSAPTEDKTSATWLEVNQNQLAAIKLNSITTENVEKVDEATKQRLNSALTDYNYQAVIKALREDADVALYKVRTGA
ncbi:SurA N-terminal domain-containing protein [Catenovulum maritimum]|uniref:Periplasmic chaperone PpiD n=1 Tax=Catenovulum maritimum TaxID=1513271 RepID=A0A0J8GSG4_9ALTE|nr:SurA N-terminal domain-containing protein [Catenovulum maritimum]KMT65740.1 hypothetical protein XM47_06930 [Catenovulum maritimum]